MKDSYLLAASLLTGLAIPASALPHLSILQSNDSSAQANVKEDSLPVNQKIAPSVENSSPEFSNQGLQTPIESSFNPNVQPAAHRKLTSGSQLYYERLAALRAGQIYTRSANYQFQSLWQKAKQRKPTYEDWRSLLALEAKAIANGQGDNHLSVLVGDSLSMWFPSEKLPTGKLWLNQGISGDTSYGVLKRLSAFSQTRPDVIYVMAGINDLRKGATDEVVLRNLNRIIRRLRQTHPESRIMIQSILPTRIPTIPNSRIRHLNQQIARIAKQEGANYLNIHTWFVDFQGNLRRDLTTDGLHLNANGYEVWQSAIGQIEKKITISRISR